MFNLHVLAVMYSDEIITYVCDICDANINFITISKAVHATYVVFASSSKTL